MNHASAAHEEKAKVPLYEDIAARVAVMIGSGAYRAGDRLPSVRELSRQMRRRVSGLNCVFRSVLIACNPPRASRLDKQSCGLIVWMSVAVPVVTSDEKRIG